MSKSGLEILSPQPVDVAIGERLFIQKPLSLRGTTALLTALGEEIQKASSSPALATFMATDLNALNPLEMMQSLLQVITSLPDALPRILAIILTGKDAWEDVEFIETNATLPVTLRIFRVFVEQNEPDELIENFTVLRKTLMGAVSSAREPTI